MVVSNHSRACFGNTVNWFRVLFIPDIVIYSRRWGVIPNPCRYHRGRWGIIGRLISLDEFVGNFRLLMEVDSCAEWLNENEVLQEDPILE